MSDRFYAGAPVGLYRDLEGYAAAKGILFHVDGTFGSDTNSGKTPTDALKTIQKAVDLVGSQPGGFVKIYPKKVVALAVDPTSYAETVIIGYDTPNLTLYGVGSGRTQGGLPQIKIGSGTTAMIDVRAPGCNIVNLCINGAGSTGGGIALTDNGTDPATTATSFGTTIENCYFKNCKKHATNGAVGGAIYTVTSAPWQVRIKGNKFYKCVGGIVIAAGSAAVPQDWEIEDNVFGSSANTEVDVDIYVGSGGALNFNVCRNRFETVDGCAGTSGTVNLYVSFATGTKGLMADNMFACISGQDDTPLSFGASTHTGGLVPATMRMAGNYGESAVGSTDKNGGLIYRTD